MNEISKIKLPNNVTYELRDNEAARIYLQSTQPEASNGSFWGWTSIPMPEKGQVITMNLDGSNKQYRVLKVNGTAAEVLAQFQYGTSAFGDTDNTYTNSDLDSYINTTYYNTLSTEAKNAIIDKSLIQYEYASNSSVKTTSHQSYADYSTKTQKAVVGSRHCYAVGVEDIEEYFNGVFTTEQLLTMFNATSANSAWLNSARNELNHAWVVFGSSGSVLGNLASNNNGVYPTFQIDLSKISWS